ncbi:hypothetical protein PG993_003717 [Apiospora rasikravindrae]|uniref:Uncharacterized protein n=1 Tax=Apiospora rasikravindrae TaxID=990691 RepID=A0ABR1U0C5_9PEZI
MCDTSGRHIAVTRLMGKFSEVGICRRTCTFWPKANGLGDWNCIIICDPPIRRIVSDYSGIPGSGIHTSPHGSGYIDFMPLSHQVEVHSGPPRSSMLNDLLFYTQNHANKLHLSDPQSLRFFAERIVASQYLNLASLQTNIDIVQWQLSRKQDLTSFAVSTAEELWSDIQAWERRIAEYQDDVEGSMLQLGVPFGCPPDTSLTRQSFTSNAADFQYIRLRFQQIGQRVHVLSGAIRALASLAGNRAMYRTAELSLREAEQARHQSRSLKGLTVMSVVFLPLSISASLLSMTEIYLPGGELFWVYLGISLPLLGLVATVYFLVKLGYKNGKSGWTLGAVVENLRRRSVCG